MMSRDGCLVSLLLILSFSLSPALADRRRSKGLEYEVLRCIDECDNTDIREYLLCQRDCELKHGEHQAEEEQQYGRRRLDPRWQPRRGGKRIPEPAPESEYERCLRACESEGTGGRGREGERWRRQCDDRCEELRRAQERKRDWEREREILVIDGRTSPRGSRERLERCLRWCERQPRGQQRQLCRFRCHHHQPQLRGEEVKYHEGEDDEMKSWGSGENPYYFHSRRFRSQLRTELGHMRVLENFSKRSELLKGIRNYRFAILEAGPRTVVVPHRTDADCVLFVLNGRGTISLIQQEKRESYELERGDVIKVPAGTVSNLTSDGNKLIQIAKLVHPVNTPGSFQPHFLAGSEEPESYFWAFSGELLETAFRAPRDQLKRLFGQQGQGVIIRHRDEQLKGPNPLDNPSKQKKKKKRSGSSSKSRGPFNLLNEQPIYSNKFGRFFQASPKETKQLQDLGISVTFAEVNQGAMMLPHYNSRTTTLVFVQDGSGYFEMASLHPASERRGPRQEAEEQEETSGQYRRVAAHLSPGDFFVIPAGHPIAIVASRNENLRMVGFGIDALNNQRNCLAGRGNMASQIDEEAKQLPFGAPAREIDRVLDSQDRSYFVAAPPTDAEGRAVGSILDPAGLL